MAVIDDLQFPAGPDRNFSGFYNNITIRNYYKYYRLQNIVKKIQMVCAWHAACYPNKECVEPKPVRIVSIINFSYLNQLEKYYR